MPFRYALGGINAASSGLATTANNIANAGTTGFRNARTVFSTGPNGNGTRVAGIAQQQTQGSIRFTDRSLDAAISGNGFFVLSENGSRLYTRAGEFGVDADGFVVNSQGHRLQAYPGNGNGLFNTARPTDLRVAGTGITEVSIDQDGVVLGRNSSGQLTTLGKVAIANFRNPQGLQPVDGTAWAETAASGPAALGEAGTSSYGSIQAGALESSNVDLTEQLLQMIEYARQFEMQTRVIRTASENMETTIRMLGST